LTKLKHWWEDHGWEVWATVYALIAVTVLIWVACGLMAGGDS